MSRGAAFACAVALVAVMFCHLGVPGTARPTMTLTRVLTRRRIR